VEFDRFEIAILPPVAFLITVIPADCGIGEGEGRLATLASTNTARVSSQQTWLAGS
jgi:hypothetical protein